MRDLFDRSVRWTLPLLLYAFLGSTAVLAQELPLGAQMPMADQSLANASGGQAALSGLRGERGTVVVFWSNQCPWIDKYADRVTSLAGDFEGQGVSVVLVNSNDAEAYPQESLEQSREKGYGVAYLMDPESRLARAFGAERTPHVFVFDPNNALVYVGTIDDSPGDAANVQKTYLRDALTALVGGGASAVPQTKAFGCTIKFKN